MFKNCEAISQSENFEFIFSSNCKFVLRNTDFITLNLEFISHNSEKMSDLWAVNSQLWKRIARCKLVITFFIFLFSGKNGFPYYIDSLKVTEYFLISAFLEIGGIKHLFILRTNCLESWLLQNPQKYIVYNTNFIFKQCVTSSRKTTKKYFILNFNLWTGFRRAASHKII